MHIYLLEAKVMFYSYNISLPLLVLNSVFLGENEIEKGNKERRKKNEATRNYFFILYSNNYFYITKVQFILCSHK